MLSLFSGTGTGFVKLHVALSSPLTPPRS